MTTKYAIVLVLISLTTVIYGQSATKKNKKRLLLTKEYEGYYSFGNSVEKGAVGSVKIYPETDTSVLFFINLHSGPPSNNTGQLYSRLQIKNGKAYYYSKKDLEKKGCRWQIIIYNNVLTIKTMDNCYECGFGQDVIADNEYKLKSGKKPKYFRNEEGRKIFFSKIKPEDYLK